MSKRQQTKNRSRKNYTYSAVPQFDNDDDITLHSEMGVGMTGNPRAKRLGNEISNYIHSLFWICLALFVIRYSDLIRVIRLDDRILFPLLCISGVSWCGCLLIVTYLTIFLPCCKKVKVDDYNVTHPQYIKGTIFLAITSYITFIVSIWPIWGWMSILIASSILMGLIMIPNFIPNCW